MHTKDSRGNNSRETSVHYLERNGGHEDLLFFNYFHVEIKEGQKYQAISIFETDPTTPRTRDRAETHSKRHTVSGQIT